MPLTVRSAMTQHVQLSPATGLHEAIVRMGYAPIAVVVERGRVKGIVARSDLDVAQARHRQAVRQNPFLDEPTIDALVRENVVLVGPETPLTRATSLLQANRTPALPVVDGPKLVGVVTLRNAIDQLQQLWRWDTRLAA